MKKIFITGATGFIGSHLLKTLVKKGYKVTILTRDPSKIKLTKNIKIIKGDITKPHTFRKELAKNEIVVHLAGIRANWADPNEFINVNTNSIKNLFVKNSKIKKIIITSSVYAMGDLYALPANEDAPLRAKDLYGKTKISAESLTKELAKENKIHYTIVRPAIVYGPGDNELGMMVKFIELIKMRKFPLIGGGKNLIHLIYIDDLVEGLVKVIEQKAENETFILAGPQPIKVLKLKSLIEKELKLNSSRIYIPRLPLLFTSYVVEFIFKLGYAIAPKKFTKEPPLSPAKVKNLSSNWHYDISKAKKTLGFNPKINYKEGIKKMLIDSHSVA